MLCAVAFAFMQGFGSGRLYRCECSEAPQFTSIPACDTGAGMDCHIGGEGEHGEHHNHQHLSARDDMNGGTHAKVAAPASPLVSELPRSEVRIDFGASACEVWAGVRFGGDSPPPRTSVAVARSVVILI